MPSNSIADELTKLKKLLDDGVLTEMEFEKQKTLCLNGTAIAPSNPIDSRSEYTLVLDGIATGKYRSITKYLMSALSIEHNKAERITRTLPSVLIENTTLLRCQEIQDHLQELGGTTTIQHVVGVGCGTKTTIVCKKHGYQDIINCPRCGSSSITTSNRGWKWTTGLIGSGRTVNRCGACGYAWEP